VDFIGGAVGEVEVSGIEILVYFGAAGGEKEARGFGGEGGLQMEMALAGKYGNGLAAEHGRKEADFASLESEGAGVALENDVFGVEGFGETAVAQRAIVGVGVLSKEANRRE
jgi:hypothetical protein